MTDSSSTAVTPEIAAVFAARMVRWAELGMTFEHAQFALMKMFAHWEERQPGRPALVNILVPGDTIQRDLRAFEVLGVQRDSVTITNTEKTETVTDWWLQGAVMA